MTSFIVIKLAVMFPVTILRVTVIGTLEIGVLVVVRHLAWSHLCSGKVLVLKPTRRGRYRSCGNRVNASRTFSSGYS